MTTPRPNDNSKALDAFGAIKDDIDILLARLTALSAAHFDTAPEAITWGHVGTLQDYRTLLRQITDSAFGEGEHVA